MLARKPYLIAGASSDLSPTIVDAAAGRGWAPSQGNPRALRKHRLAERTVFYWQRPVNFYAPADRARRLRPLHKNRVRAA